MKRMVLLPLAIAWLTPALALAAPPRHDHQQRNAAGAQEPLHLQVARAVFPRESWKRFMAQASTELTEQIAETGKGQIELAPGFADRLRERYEQLVPYEEMLSYQARLLESRYSKAELRRLLVFYRTPLGRKSFPFMHDLLSSSMQRAQVQVQNGLSEALAQLRPLVRKLPSAGDGEAQSGSDEQGEGSGPVPGDDGAKVTSPPADDGNAL